MPKQCATLFAAVLAFAVAASGASAQPAPNCPTMRKINIGVSVAPPNVVHTSPYVAKALGFFAKRCIDANIVQFEGGQSQTSNVAAAQGTAIVSVSDVAIGRGLKVQQIWGLAPRMPQVYMVQEGITSAAQLKGKRLSATGGGVGGFNWRMGREVLKSAGLTENDAQFIPSPTAGRLPGLIANQIDGVALHPEDVYLAKQQKPSLNALLPLVELMPLYMFNAYGASTEWIARDRPLLRDTVAAMIEANRTIYREKDKVIPIIVEATQKPRGRGRIRLETWRPRIACGRSTPASTRSARNGRSTTASRTAMSRPARSRRWSRSPTWSSPRKRWSSPAARSRSATARSSDSCYRRVGKVRSAVPRPLSEFGKRKRARMMFEECRAP